MVNSSWGPLGVLLLLLLQSLAWPCVGRLRCSVVMCGRHSEGGDVDMPQHQDVPCMDVHGGHRRLSCRTGRCRVASTCAIGDRGIWSLLGSAQALKLYFIIPKVDK
ncbi:hypothetical protein K439DRAFT_1045124 [Ramaria rubella]|nr:hypothetical protein K439DRAFT_1045124 [Ramaria rubella]